MNEHRSDWYRLLTVSIQEGTDLFTSPSPSTLHLNTALISRPSISCSQVEENPASSVVWRMSKGLGWEEQYRGGDQSSDGKYNLTPGSH